MARTAPAPNIPPIPGMCPSVALLAGGGDAGGGGGGSAGDGSGDNNAGAGKGGENPEADGRGAPDYQKYPECGYASHPVDVVTGRAFTHPVVDLALPGPLELELRRMYSSKTAHLDVGLGYGWAHTFGWRVEVKRRSIVVWNEQGIAVDFPMIRQGDEVIGPWGWVLRREAWGFAVDADDGVWHLFSEPDPRQAGFHLLTAVEDRNRNRISLTYDEGRLCEIKDSAGRVVRVGVTREGRIASFSVQNAISQGQWVAFATYTYDERGDLVAVTDADGFTARFEYDEDHRLTLDQDRAGLTFHFVYDREGRCVESWGDYPGKRDPSLAEGLPRYLHDGQTVAKGIHHCRFEYGADGFSEVVDSTQSRRFFGNKHGTLDKSVTATGVMTATYRDDGHLLSRTDGLGATTSFDLDARGRVIKIVDPLGRVTTLDRDAAGLIVHITDAGGGTTAMHRDRFGNVTAVTDAAGRTTTYTYDARGLVESIVDPNGARTTCVNDEAGNVTTVTQPNGGAFRYTHDRFGRRTSRTDPLGATTRYAYSNRGDLISMTDAIGGVTRYAYDGEGHLVAVIDPKGQRTELGWGGYHCVTTRRNAAGGELHLRYDREGQLIELHDERGAVHTLSYDPGGKLVGEKTFDGRSLGYRNDAAGRPIQMRDGEGRKTVLKYDLAGQVIERELPDGTKEAYEWSPIGDLIGARLDGVEIILERDELGRIVRERQIVDDDEATVESTWDATDARASRRTSLGHAETITRDAMGVRTATALGEGQIVHHARDLLGREVERVLPNGGRVESAFDPLGRLSRRRALRPFAAPDRSAGEPDWLHAPRGPISAERAYRYDWDGELLETLDSARGSVEYRYDPVGRVLAIVPEKGRAELFAYDAAGNVSREGAPSTYDPGNRITRAGDTEHVWDAAGRLVEKRSRREDGVESVWRYTWNGAGLLRSAKGPGGALVEFRYDAFARRVEKRVSRARGEGERPRLVSVTRFVWDRDSLVHEIKRAAAAGGDPVVEERTYCFDDDGLVPLAHRDGREGGFYHYVNDPIGTPERLIDGRGEIAAELERKGLSGLSPVLGGKTRTPLRFQGQYHDEETGLSYSRHRYFDAETSRFISADPSGLRGGINVFAYAPNSLTWADPFGLAGKGRAWLGYAKIYHDKRADAIFGAGKGTSVGGRNYDKKYKGKDVEYKSDNFSKGPRSKESLARMCTQIDKDAANKAAGDADPHWHFEHDPSKAADMKPVLDKLDAAGIPYTHGPTAF